MESTSNPQCGPRRLIQQHFDAAGIQIPDRHLQVVMDQTAEKTYGESSEEAGH